MRAKWEQVQLLRGLCALAEEQFRVHRDVKPENVQHRTTNAVTTLTPMQSGATATLSGRRRNKSTGTMQHATMPP